MTIVASMNRFRLKRYTVGQQTYFDILDESGSVRRTMSNGDLAVAAMERMVKAEATTKRPCITCRRTFLSEGIHQRMCESCVLRANDCGMI